MEKSQIKEGQKISWLTTINGKATKVFGKITEIGGDFIFRAKGTTRTGFHVTDLLSVDDNSIYIIGDKLQPTENTLKQARSELLRVHNPNYSYCGICKFPWNYCEHRIVQTSITSGTFATCKECWDRSTLTELKAVYTETYNEQVSGLPDGFEMQHTLEHLLSCVERDFNQDMENILNNGIDYGRLLR